MIKNKVVNIKIIFKNIKEWVKNNFRFPNKFLFYKISDNSFQKLFLKTIFFRTIFKNSYQTWLYFFPMF